MRKLFVPLAAVLLAAGCDGTVQRGDNAVAGAENRAEEGQLTVETPGVDLKINIPEPLRGRGRIDGDNRLVYPGSTLAGLHVSAGEENAGHGEVEMRFTSRDAPDQVAAWYRDPARSGDFTVGSAARDGDAYVIDGTGRREGERFRVRLAPRSGGGTDGRLLISETR